MSKGRIALLLLAVAAVAFSLFNASWIASAPPGRLVLVASRGIIQKAAEGTGGPCPGTRLAAAPGQFFENTIPALRQALGSGAQGVAVDARRTADNRMVAFRDETLDCRTDGAGPLAARTLAELKQLDVAARYTADGSSFPVRGHGRGMMPSVDEILYAVPTNPIVFMIHGNAPADADALAAEFARAGLPIDNARFGFTGPEAVLARLRTLAPKAWFYSKAASEACLSGYRATGWIGIVPDACRGATAGVVPGPNWTLWGWPFRFMSRIAGAGGRTILAESYGEDGAPTGLTSTDQIDDVPRGFTGLVFIEDMAGVGSRIDR